MLLPVEEAAATKAGDNNNDAEHGHAAPPGVDHIIDSLVKAHEQLRQDEPPRDEDQDMDDVMKVITDLDHDLDRNGLDEVVADPSAPDAAAKGDECDARMALERECQELSSRHVALERRYDSLRRRIHRVRIRQLNAHASKQIACLRSRCAPSRPYADGPSSSALPFTSALATASTTSLVSTVASCPSTASTSAPRAPLVVSSSSKSRLVDTLGQLESNVSLLRSDYDSEATESSSGGESADEIDFGAYNTSSAVSYYSGVKKRAKFVWLSRRAEIASRWTWLTAQIADLEYKVRQQTDLYRHIRTNKGSVQLGDAVVSWPPHAKKPVIATTSASQPLPLNCQPVTKSYCKLKNDQVSLSISPQLSPQSSPIRDSHSFDNNNDDGCSRVRPLKELRRRKIVRLDQRQTLSSAIDSSKCGGVRFNCDVEEESGCVLWSNHSRLSLKPDPLTAERENTALLDHSYHKVLSSGQDVRLSLPLSSVLKSKRDWPSTQVKSSSDAKTADKISSTRNEAGEKHVKRTPKRSNKAIRDRKISSRRKSLSIYNSSDDRTPSMHDFDADEATCSSQMSTQAWAEHIKRRRGTAFDINNIVIPYSIASTTRVEKLKYKEILTPTWRIIKPATDVPVVNNSVLKKNSEIIRSEEHEVMNDETFERRHCRAELEERKRWQLPAALNKNSSRSQRRQDSCQTSSGTNTPADIPSSPAPLDTPNEISTRPPTPTSMGNEDSNQSSVSSVTKTIEKRRRTTSSSASRSRDRNPSAEDNNLGSNIGNVSSLSAMNDSANHSESQLLAKAPSNFYEIRKFPLNETDYRAMLEEVKPEVNGVNGAFDSTKSVSNNKNIKVSSRRGSSSGESIEESSFLLVDEDTVGEEEESDWNDDPDDPEWSASERLNALSGNNSEVRVKLGLSDLKVYETQKCGKKQQS